MTQHFKNLKWVVQLKTVQLLKIIFMLRSTVFIHGWQLDLT